jgi:hypothetical protein
MGVDEEPTLVDPDASSSGLLDGQNVAPPTGDSAANGDASTDSPSNADATADADATTTDADATVVGVDAAASATALSFDGIDDVVRVTRQVQDDFTIEAWINTTVSRSGGSFFDGLGLVYADVSGVANDFGTSILNGRFAFGAVSTTIQSTTIVTTGTWIHVAAVRVRTTGVMRILVNGAQEGTATGSTAALTAPSSIDIGGNTIDSRYFTGKIDEVRVWNVARSNAQILATMKTKLVGNEAGLVGYWRFDDGSGVIANDSSPSNNDGSLGNGSANARPTWVTSGAF